MEEPSVESCMEDWRALEEEYVTLEAVHKGYKEQLDVMLRCQKKCLDGIKHQRYITKRIKEHLRSVSKTASPEDKVHINELYAGINERSMNFRDMEECLPHPNGIYLQVILGNVNVSLLSKSDKFKYKEEYEKFKLVVVIITMVLALVNLVWQSYRWTEAVLHFLLVWYYCTLTIRESILIVNGSRIKGWWVAHHYVSTVLSGIVLIWPDGKTYSLFRDQFILFTLWISIVNIMQYYYQRGCLYRLRALGERHNMDITVEGFQSWMWRGLSFLLPFLVIAYLFQLYNAYTLYELSFHPECKEWQVLVLALIFLILFIGNTSTISMVLYRKVRGTYQHIFHKYKEQ